ncbi:3-oxoacyl-[acyl-carrier protein] reductase [Corallococcus coralloides DSM 2259]|uniref:3-oxoacyl-[acyl-carrier protein] reductase n=1 Tax=Corallococcus coralloides (strain ATCC 25202 / DSM 2259 / NBRC 100086 / M2) TaxID=1144275 RepID=H8MIM6_CORCM|nr:SDR family NAD(P)-dependent oxidoreductase [Corallococcus coralloides]AFE11170.1 3-oxoacyl-[acyl-carrier protein] reductase [Corallococcus coralloides DSM 2259]
MRIELTGRTALVTGSTAGIGLATAKGLAAAGATVIVNGRTQEAVDRAIAAVREAAPGATVKGFAGDLSTAKATTALVAAHPHCDILINNLGIFGPKDFFDVSDEDWSRFFEANVLSGVRLSRAYLPGMQKQGWGRVVFVSSESALNIPTEMIHYGVTKTAQLAVARGLAKRMAGTGVTVNSVLPGPTLSEGVRTMFREEHEKSGRSFEDLAVDFIQASRPSSILRRPSSVEEVANMIVYVASPQASATTGAALRVDGGVVDSIA